MEVKTSGLSRGWSLWRRNKNEWCKDVKRTREKRGALATLRKWREKEGLAHSRREKRECV